MDTFVESLRAERLRLQGMLEALESGHLATGDRIVTTPVTIRHIQKQVRELGVLIGTYEDEDAQGS